MSSQPSSIPLFEGENYDFWCVKMKRKSEHERRENWEEIREEGYRSHMRVMGMREKEWVGWLGR